MAVSCGQKFHYLAGMLVFGTCTSITMKMQLLMMCVGYGGLEHTFDKPFFQSIAMFVSMAVALPSDLVISGCRKRKVDSKAERQPLVGDENIQQPTDAKPHKKSHPIVIAAPASFDLIASTMMTYGLIYVSVSIFQMLRGSMVIFSTILTRIFLPGRRVLSHQIFGILLCFIALCMVGLAGLLIPQPNQANDPAKMLIGIALVIGSQIVQAGQIVIEEFLLRDLDMTPMRVVGFEGLWGTLAMILIACPLAYVVPGFDYSTMPHNSLENTIDSFICLASNKMLIIAVLLFCVAVFAYNCYGMLITDSFSAINRTIFEAVRTAVVWIVSLIIQLIAKGSPYGETWCRWSWLELAGFLVLFFSSLTYNGVVKFPFLHEYDLPTIVPTEKKDEKKAELDNPEDAPDATATPVGYSTEAK